MAVEYLGLCANDGALVEMYGLRRPSSLPIGRKPVFGDGWAIELLENTVKPKPTMPILPKV